MADILNTGSAKSKADEAKEAMENLSKVMSLFMKDFDKLANKFNLTGDSAKQFGDTFKQLTSVLGSEEKAVKSMLDAVSNELEAKGVQVNASSVLASLKAKGLTDDIIKFFEEYIQAERRLTLGVQGLAKEMSAVLMKPFDVIISYIEKIPGGKLLSKVFNFKDAGKKLQADIIGILQESFTNKGQATIKTFGAVTKSVFKAVGDAMKTLWANPMLLALTLLIGGLYVAYKQWNKVVDAAKALRTETGLTGDAAWDLTQSTKDIAIQFTNMGVSMEVVGKATAALVNEFQTTAALSHDMYKNASLMVGALGVAPDVAAKTLRVFKNMGVESGQATTNMIGLVSESAKLAGVAPSAIFKDLAESSKEIYTYFKGNVVNAAKAAIELRRMGTSLKEAAATSKNLLDFESNITSELEASVLAGRQLDFSRARYLAFTGDLVGSQQAVLDQIQKMGNFDKMNLIQKEAIAKASGMELDKLENMLEQRKEIAKMNPAEKKAYKDSLAALEEFRKGNKGNLIQQNQQLLAQEKMKKNWEDIIQKLSSVLFPLFEGIYDVIDSIANAVQSILSSSEAQWMIGAFKTIGGWLKTISEGLSKIGLVAIPITIIAVLLLKNAFGNLFRFLGGQISKIGTWFKGTKTGGFLGKIFGNKKDIDDAAKGSKEMKGIGQRIKEFFQGFREVKVGDILKFALVLGVLAGGLYAFGLALQSFKDVKWDSVLQGITTIGAMVVFAKLLKSSSADMIVGAIAIAMLAGVLYLFGKALQTFIGIEWKTLAIAGVALLGLTLALMGIGALMSSGVGAVALLAGAAALVVIAGAVWVLGKALQEFVPIVKPFAEALSIIINSIGDQIVKVINAVADSISRIANINALNLLGVASGIVAVGAALAAFGGGSIAAGIGSFIGNFLGGDPIEKMERLAAIAPGLNVAASAVAALGASLNNLKVPEIENIDELSDIAEASLKVQTNKQTNVNVAAPNNDALLKKLDELVQTMKSLEVKMDGKKVGEVISNATPQLGRA